ncbi:sugar-transfer associated ATP-grasp domain-containing protein [Virgibacillus oceani]
MKEKQLYQDLGFKTKSKHFKRYLNAGLLNDIDKPYIEETQRYWQNHYGQMIEPSLNMAFMNLTGKKGTKIIPGTVMWDEIIPFFNDLSITPGYRDKNIYDILMKTPRSVSTVLKCVRKHYFDSSNSNIDELNAKEKLLAYKSLIIKPSNNNNGVGIEKLIIKNNQILLNGQVVTINDLANIYDSNFIVQEVIKQHSIMAAPHPSSVNSLRMVTFRWKGNIHHLLTFARFGANNDVKDNAGTGGVCLGVTDTGCFLDLAIDEKTQTYTHHPTTNFCFAELDQIPNFEEFKDFVITSHKDIIHHDFISWDVAVGEDGRPIFIEANFAGATWLYQLAAQKPIFGELTDEVLHYVANEKERISFSYIQQLKNRDKAIKRQDKKIVKMEEEVSNYNSAEIILRKKLSKIKKKNKKLEHSLKDNEKKLEEINMQYNNLKNSKTFRYTQPVRTIISKFKNKKGKPRSSE